MQKIKRLMKVKMKRVEDPKRLMKKKLKMKAERDQEIDSNAIGKIDHR